MIGEDSILTIVDFTKSSKEKRLYVVDLKNQDILFQTLVAHGKNSGKNTPGISPTNKNPTKAPSAFTSPRELIEDQMATP
jgi:hypothetical protein